jgi:hypothetical protein
VLSGASIHTRPSPPPSSTFNYSERHASRAPRSSPTSNTISHFERAKVLKFWFVILSYATRNSAAILHTKQPYCIDDTRISKNSEQLGEYTKTRLRHKPPFTPNTHTASFSLYELEKKRSKYFNLEIVLFKRGI